MNLRSILIIGLFVITMFFSQSCTVVTVDAGEEAALVEQPILFGHGGVDDVPVETGRSFVAVTTNYTIFKITPVTITEEFKDMIPADNTPVSFNAYIKLKIRKGYTPMLFKLFGEKWYENSIKETFRTMVRDMASRYKMFDLASDRFVSITIQDSLMKQLTNYVAKVNIPIDVLQVVIGAITPPEQVLTETKNTAAQNQSILTQSARAKAELSRKEAEVNKAIADKAYQSEMNMSIDEYLKLRQLEIEKEKVELIKDKQNVSIVFGSSVQPVLNVK
ncbi:MAG TPA: SPFH domain-containing protein [Bacteroidia bacterium]|nr:SPFH domain-containing protein [Bacteroidia bacterium]